MRHRMRIAIAAALLTTGTLAAVLGCSKKDDNPTGPGGGGGGLELNSPDIAQHGTFAHLFATAGTFPYHCARHPSMLDTVTVQVGAPMTANVDISGFAFGPNPLIVAPGGTVTWTNHDTALHTVTSDAANP
jgi:plastocyanin